MLVGVAQRARTHLEHAPPRGVVGPRLCATAVCHRFVPSRCLPQLCAQQLCISCHTACLCCRAPQDALAVDAFTSSDEAFAADALFDAYRRYSFVSVPTWLLARMVVGRRDVPLADAC